MPFDNRLWDDTDELYAPCISWSKPTHAVWKAPKRYVEAGYPIKRKPLAGSKGDGQDAQRAKECRQLTREMVRWFDAIDHSGPEAGTWGELFDRYKNDPYSPIMSVKPTTKKHYIEQVAKLEEALGCLPLSALTYESAMSMKIAMESKGRSVAYITRLFKQFRAVASYGRTLALPGAADACNVLRGIKLETPPARSVFPTREEVMQVIAHADKQGMHAFACGYLMCFELSLRAVDVRGQWSPTDVNAGIVRDGKRWEDGLTWNMISPDLTSMTKVISKTRKSMPESYVFDLSLLPEVQRRLAALRERSALGPVIVSETTGLPYTTTGWSQAFRRIKKRLGLRSELTAMDVRAGGMTEARMVASDPVLLRDAGQHKQTSTTDKYLRDRSGGANRVVRLRGAKR